MTTLQIRQAELDRMCDGDAVAHVNYSWRTPAEILRSAGLPWSALGSLCDSIVKAVKAGEIEAARLRVSGSSVSVPVFRHKLI